MSSVGKVLCSGGNGFKPTVLSRAGMMLLLLSSLLLWHFLLEYYSVMYSNLPNKRYRYDCQILGEKTLINGL